MTTAPRQRTRTRPTGPVIPDLSYVKANPAYRENPDYILAALELGGLVTCSECKRVVGLGTGPENAIDDGIRKGTAFKVGDDIRCQDHSRRVNV